MARRPELGATNQPGSCLYCGRKLRPYRYRAEEWAAARGLSLGDYGDGYFCGLRCGYEFGKALAGHGRRIKAAPVSA